MLLIIYVDDLLLAGPADQHEKFWTTLSKQVNPDPYEDLDRYLGRHHSLTPCDKLDYNLKERFESPVIV